MYRILVVDDELQMAKVLEEFLVKSGFLVTKALNGEDAINILTSGSTKIDLMILDMKMPKVSGMDVLTEMKNMNKIIPAIILSGSVDTEKYLAGMTEFGYASGDILCKPVDLFQLLDVVKKKLGLNENGAGK